MSWSFQDVDLGRLRSSERNLLCAILLRAWADLDSINRFIRNDAYNWLDLRENPNQAWTFPWICIQLGLNARATRKKMVQNPFYEMVQKVTPERYGRTKKAHCGIYFKNYTYFSF